MLLLALFLPPLALYLIVLGWINRRPRPVTMGGTWDFAGVLFAVSGFVLAGGPAFLGSLDERSRLFWLLGETGTADGGSDSGTFWIAVRLFYFAVVAGGAAVLLWRGRRLTSVYNVDTPTVVSALEQAFQRLGLTPIRSGDSYTSVGGPTVEVDSFPLMRHVTLRWDPADAPLRREVERELAADAGGDGAVRTGVGPRLDAPDARRHANPFRPVRCGLRGAPRPLPAVSAAHGFLATG